MPSEDQVRRALEQISKSAANYRYFFEKLNDPRWLAPLKAKGRFTKPPEKEEVENGTRFPNWPESEYLARMALIPGAQSTVLQIALAMEETDNIRVHADLLDIALRLPPAAAAALSRRARNWINTPFDSLVSDKIGDLIAYLAAGGETEAALNMASAALELLPPAEAQGGFSTREPRAWLRDWSYEQTIKTALPALVRTAGIRALALFSGLLERAIVLSRAAADTPGEDYSYIWHEAIENDEYPPQIRNTLITATRDTATRLVEADLSKLSAVVQELRRHAWPVFHRIELHLLRQHLRSAVEYIAEHADALAQTDGATRHEAALLIKESFSLLPDPIQEAILERINAGPRDQDLQAWFHFVGKEATPAAMAQLSLEWRAERFALIAENVPVTWRERVQQVLAASERVRHLEALPQRGGWMGPEAAKTAEELELLGPAGVVDYLRGWTPMAGAGTTPEGQGRVFETLVAKDPQPYAAEAATFQAIDPTYVRFLISGLDNALQQGKSFAWISPLALSAWVGDQPRTIPGRVRNLMEADQDWQWTRSAIASLLEHGMAAQDEQAMIPYTARQEVWGVLQQLMTDPDPTSEDEARFGTDSMDAATLAINSVRGKTLNAVVAYALWVRRHLDRETPRPDATFDLMPEVREVLNEHLAIGRDPSLAIRSCYGRHLPWLHLLDPIWVGNNVPNIFPTAHELSQYRHAAWNTYVTLCRAYSPMLEVLRSQYLIAVHELSLTMTEKRHGRNPGEAAVDHFMTLYSHGALVLDDEILTAFFHDAPANLRGRAVGLLGRWLPTQESKETVAADILDRIRLLWEWRLNVARQAPDPKMFQSEISEFGWWFGSPILDETWRLHQLLTVLGLVKTITPYFRVIETLADLANRFPLECIQCARIMAVDDKQGWNTLVGKDDYKTIIIAALKSPNPAASQEADALVQFFVGRGDFEYRMLLQ